MKLDGEGVVALTSEVGASDNFSCRGNTLSSRPWVSVLRLGLVAAVVGCLGPITYVSKMSSIF